MSFLQTSTYDFCDFNKAEYEVIELSLNNIFKVTDFEVIRKAYKNLIELQKSGLLDYGPKIDRNTLFPLTSQQDLITKYCQPSSLVGIDLPSIWRPRNGIGKTIFILAQDPRRNPKDEFLNKTELSTPFGTHLRDFRENKKYKQTIHWQVILFFLNKGYNVYLTDAYKIWIKDWRFKNTDDLIHKFILCFKGEVEFFNPPIIVSYGNSAKTFVDRLGLTNKNIHFIHPSGTASGSWKKLEYFKDKPCTIEYKLKYIINQIDLSQLL
jgi:hypothetical protein